MPRVNDGRKRTSDVEDEDNDGEGQEVGGESNDQKSARGSAPPDFSALLLREEVVKGLEKEGYMRPSPIQARAIPIGKFGADLIAQAKSGTGKTCVFAVIVLDTLKLEFRSPQALIIAPTRELAHQTRDVVRSIGAFMPGLGCEAFVGGIATNEDVALLQDSAKCCHVVAGTPGRVRALIEMGALAVEGLRQLVLDEADVLLSDAFRPQVDVLFMALPLRKQVIAVSATYTPDLLALVRGYMRDPQEVLLVRETASLKGVRQFYQAVGGGTGGTGPLERQIVLNTRMKALVEILETTSFHQCIVFTNSRGVGQRAATLLDKLGFPSRFVCGDQQQKTRLETIAALREFKLRVLVSSDLTSRGIDVDTVNMVVNFELPASHETYLHRVGRTGRFGTFGVAVTIVDTAEEKAILDMATTLHINIAPRPAVIPTELYEYALEEGTEQGKRLGELLETRKKAQEDAPAAQELLQQLSLASSKAQVKGVHQSAGTHKGVHQASSTHTAKSKQGGQERYGETAQSHHVHSLDAHANQAVDDSACDEASRSTTRYGRGRNLGCLCRGAAVDVIRTEGTKQVVKSGWVHAPGQIPGQFWVMLDGCKEPVLTDVQCMYRNGTTRPPQPEQGGHHTANAESRHNTGKRNHPPPPPAWTHPPPPHTFPPYPPSHAWPPPPPRMHHAWPPPPPHSMPPPPFPPHSDHHPQPRPPYHGPPPHHHHHLHHHASFPPPHFPQHDRTRGAPHAFPHPPGGMYPHPPWPAHSWAGDRERYDDSSSDDEWYP